MIKELETAIGYRFHNISLLQNALAHSSYANERWHNSLMSNERLEFLGDSILGMLVADHLYRNFPNRPEGELTRMRADMVCERALAVVAGQIGLGGHMLLGKGEEATGGRKRPSILADAFAAVIGAIFLDGGMDNAKKFVRRFLDDAHLSLKDYKTLLQEIIQKNPGERLSYVVTGESGPDHNKVFNVEVHLNSNVIGKGTGKSKKQAEQAAAKEALALMGFKD